MRELAPRFYPSGSPVSPTSRFGGQPFVIGATALLAIVVGIGAIAAWRAYTALQPKLGVPSLYYVTHIDATGEALEAEDYRLIRETWAQYRKKHNLTMPAGSKVHRDDEIGRLSIHSSFLPAEG